MFFFTICSNNYLAQATVLGNSLKQFHPTASFLIILVDEKNDSINYQAIPFEILPVATIEPGLRELLIKYDIIELNTCVKPRVVEYLFQERDADTVVYLDPDIQLFEKLTELESALQKHLIILTPHIYTPIPIDDKKPSENTFLNYGLYNLGFIALRNGNETMRFVSWWKEHTYKQGFFNVKDGLFVDQLPINLVPLFFKEVYILQHFGYNMAPWNLHERYLTQQGDQYLINDKDRLKFFHFSSFRFDGNELPLHHYDRFRLKDRPDLHAIYGAYNQALKTAGYTFYAGFPCIYVNQRQQYLQQKYLEDWKKKPLLKRIALRVLRYLPFRYKPG